MNRTEKKHFVRELISNVQASILASVDKMPEEWDGHELRRYVADKFDDAAMTVGRSGPYGKPYARRTRDYRTEVAVRNL